VKGDRLGEFEEFALLAAFALGEGTYGVPIQQFIARTTGRDVSIGAVYAALGRLEAKGYVRSDLGPPSPQRGGRPKRLVEITPLGVRTVKNLRHVREHIWRVIEGDGRS
jgi:DNA-binding PadR family transcriptional regulator